jgi:DNA-binding MarR family transcriptional regulator
MATDDTGARVLDELGRLIRALSRVSGGPDEGPPLTASQRLALFELVDQGPLRLADLAARMGTSPPTASRAVDALGELGLVDRRPDPDDRRAVQLDLTPEGRREVEERKARVLDAFRPAAETLADADRRRLASLLGRLADELAPGSSS